jgi:hypothetical protein
MMRDVLFINSNKNIHKHREVYDHESSDFGRWLWDTYK